MISTPRGGNGAHLDRHRGPAGSRHRSPGSDDRPRLFLRWYAGFFPRQPHRRRDHHPWLGDIDCAKTACNILVAELNKANPRIETCIMRA